MTGQKINLGVAGLGRAFSLMIPAFRNDHRINLSAAFSPRRESREQFEHDFSGNTYGTFEELADDESVDAIYIASPHQFHAEQTRIAAGRGKHVLVEKPMALSLSECDSMIEGCAEAGVHLIVGHCHSFDTPYLRAREIIDSGKYGDVKMIHALNYTDFLYRPRRPEELNTAAGGGVIYNQAPHQIDIVRLLAGSPATRVRAALGAWDPARPTEGAYTAVLWFASGAFATLTYSGYAHFDTDEWCGWVSEMGMSKSDQDYGAARRRLQSVQPAEEFEKLKRHRNYGGGAYQSERTELRKPESVMHQHFGPVIVSCEHADVRPLPQAIVIYGDEKCERYALEPPQVPRSEVIDELYSALVDNVTPLHNGIWARATLEVCIGLLQSARENRDTSLKLQTAAENPTLSGRSIQH